MMKALAVAFVLAFAGTASAGEWDDYIDHNPHQSMPVAKSKPATTSAKATPAKTAKASRPAKKAATKSQAKSRPKTKARR